jgi:acyl-CoA reductase-like NAD-dependent aldehyde dehydrogenase
MTLSLYINGEWLASDAEFKSVNPSSGETLDSLSNASRSDVSAAVSAAVAAFPAWREVGVNRRSELLARVGELLSEAYGEAGQDTDLKAVIRRETGRRLDEADLEVQESADIVTWFADEGPRLLESEPISLDPELWPTKKSSVVYEPRGVVAIIKPWNYPIELAVWALAPALLAGNTVVFKPSEHSSLCAVELTKLFVRAGFPDGVVNLVTGDGDVGAALVAHQDVSYVAFTGGRATGRQIAEESARQLRPCSLELGGIDAAIVLDDADLELVAPGLVWGAFANAGQVCVRPKRVFAQAGIHDRLIDRVVEKTKALRRDIDFGPLISEEQRARVARQVDESIAAGARRLVGDGAVGEQGFFYEPTVLADVADSMPVFSEECFGPVLAISKIAVVDEGVERANASEAGLGASVWSTDLERAHQIALKLEAGMVWINDVNVAFPSAPWGGRKASGLGVELGRWGLQEMTNLKHVSREEGGSPTRDWWFPYGA